MLPEDEMREAQAAGATTWQNAMAHDGEAMHELEDTLNAVLQKLRGAETDITVNLHRLLTLMQHLALRYPELTIELT